MIFKNLNSGTSVEGDPITSRRSLYKGKKWLYLIAGVHGDEIEGIYGLSQWMKQIENSTHERPTIHLPVLNVDGHRHMTRVNAHGVDLNRNLPALSWSDQQRAEKYFPGPSPLSEPENIYLDELFKKYPPALILTLHSWKPMINYNGDCASIAEFMKERNHYEVVPEIKGHPTPGSLGDYAPEKYDCPVITFEFPTLKDNLSLKEIWKHNEKAFSELWDSSLLDEYLA